MYVVWVRACVLCRLLFGMMTMRKLYMCFNNIRLECHMWLL